MKRLLLSLSVPAVIAVAAPVYADPASGDDAKFLKEVTAAGLTYQNPSDAVTVAKDVCDLLDKATPESDIEKNLGSLNPSLAGNGAKKFMLISANTYCPKYLPNDDGSAKSLGPKAS